MASLNITLEDKAIQGDRFTGTLVVSGEDFSGNAFEHAHSVDFKAQTEFDVPAGPCSVHISAWLATPTQVCIDGHLQCGPARQPTNGPSCIEI